MGAAFGFDASQLSARERETLAVFFDELGATVVEGGACEGPSAVRPEPAGNPGSAPPSATVDQLTLDDKEAA